MGMEGFQGLRVWQESKALAVQIYKVTEAGLLRKDLALCDQMRRAAVAIPSNIAEGDERNTDKEAVRFFYIAKGSAAELLTQVIIAREIGHMDDVAFQDIERQCVGVAKKLSKLISARSAKNL